MNFDFSALLVLLTFASGFIWAIDAWFLAPRRKNDSSDTNSGPEGENAALQEPLLVDYARSFFPVFFSCFYELE